MITLEQFKKSMNVSEVSFGRADKKKNFTANVPMANGVTLTIYASKTKTDFKKELFIIKNDGSVNPDLEGTLWAVNTGWNAEHTV